MVLGVMGIPMLEGTLPIWELSGAIIWDYSGL